MKPKNPRELARRARKKVPSDAELKANERLIKARFYSWAMATYQGGFAYCVKDIARETGVRIPIETLRQNLRPTSAKAARSRRNFRKLRYLRALYEFTLGVGYLKGYSFAAAQDAIDTAISLTQYIGGELANSPTKLYAQLAGLFRSELDRGGYIETLEFQIEFGAEESVPLVLVTEAIEDPTTESPIETLHRQGWVVGNDAGLVLLFTRHAYEGAELYLLLQTSPNPWASVAPDVLALFRFQSASRIELNRDTLGKRTDIPLQLVPKNLLERSTLFLTRIG